MKNTRNSKAGVHRVSHSKSSIEVVNLKICVFCIVYLCCIEYVSQITLKMTPPYALCSVNTHSDGWGKHLLSSPQYELVYASEQQCTKVVITPRTV
jgi:hypothetical protein